VLRNIMVQCVSLTGLGMLLGAVAGLLLYPVLAAQLYGISGLDLPTLAAVATLLLASAALAAYLPARRAMRIDPVAALRGD
jgi:ABC-type antimicrobial peptide transport system permease subunit